jgi:hypothetical protein
MHTDEHASCDRRHVIMIHAIIRIMQPYTCMNYYPGCDQLAKASYTTGIKWSTRAKITLFFFLHNTKIPVQGRYFVGGTSDCKKKKGGGSSRDRAVPRRSMRFATVLRQSTYTRVPST